MCGVSGFFVGCEMAEFCRGGRAACRLLDDPDALHDWHRRATVRNAPRNILNEEDVDGHLFPRKLAPVLQHPIIQKLDGERICALLNNHLFRYLDFTAKLELAVVNDVMKDIAFGHMPVKFDQDTILAAHKIYVDEAYHALISVDLLHQSQSLLQVQAILPRAPRFLCELRRQLDAADGEDEKRLMRLFFVIVSETLITNSLTDIRQDGSLPDAVRKTLAQHARDEATHQRFFLGLLRGLWPMLSAADRAFVLSCVPRFIHAFVTPDYQAMTAELQMVGVSPDDAHIVLQETYAGDVIGDFALACSHDLAVQLDVLADGRGDDSWQHFRQTGGLI